MTSYRLAEALAWGARQVARRPNDCLDGTTAAAAFAGAWEGLTPDERHYVEDLLTALDGHCETAAPPADDVRLDFGE